MSPSTPRTATAWVRDAADHPPLHAGDKPPALRKERRTRSLTEVCYVYLLIHMDEPRFKIGLSRNPGQRVRQLPEARHIALDRSIQVRLPNYQRAYEVERMLHKALGGFRMKLLDEAGQSWQGSTEWFALSGLPNAIKLLRVMPADADPCVVADLETLRGQPYEHFFVPEIPTPTAVQRQEVEEKNMRKMLAIIEVLTTLREGLFMDARMVQDKRGSVQCLCIHNFRNEFNLRLTKARNKVLSSDFWALQTAKPGGKPALTVPLVRLIRYSEATPGMLELVINDLKVLRRLPAGNRVVTVWQGHLAWLSSTTWSYRTAALKLANLEKV